jgi:hypothetical protein
MTIQQEILTRSGPELKTLTPMKAIRNKCLECANWSAHEVRHCQITDCALWAYRSGRNPERKGVGGEICDHLKIAS